MDVIACRGDLELAEIEGCVEHQATAQAVLASNKPQLQPLACILITVLVLDQYEGLIDRRVVAPSRGVDR